GRVSICEISVSADVWEKCHTKGWWPAPGRPLHCYRIAVAVIAAAIAFFLVRLHSVFSYGTHRNFFKIIKKYFT
ncbi:MAG: hypothetical protein SPE56_05330, partial [Prevotella sp.]|nr:hypothetical protein [Prevotella sp.]